MIQTFLPLFTVYISAALTHLKRSVQLDAVAIVNLFLESFSEIFASSCKEVEESLALFWLIQFFKDSSPLFEASF